MSRVLLHVTKESILLWQQDSIFRGITSLAGHLAWHSFFFKPRVFYSFLWRVLIQNIFFPDGTWCRCTEWTLDNHNGVRLRSEKTIRTDLYLVFRSFRLLIVQSADSLVHFEKALLTGNCHDPVYTTMNFKAFASAQTCEINNDCDDGQGGMCFASPTIFSCSRDSVLLLAW